MLASDMLLPRFQKGSSDGRSNAQNLIGRNATPNEFLALIGEQAKIAFQAELDLFEWQADNQPAHFDEFMDQYVRWYFCAEALADSYMRIKSEYPHLTVTVSSRRIGYRRIGVEPQRARVGSESSPIAAGKTVQLSRGVCWRS